MRFCCVHTLSSVFGWAFALLTCRLQEKSEGSSDGSVEVNPMAVFHSAVLNAKPIIGTTRVTRGGKHYHVNYGTCTCTCTCTCTALVAQT